MKYEYKTLFIETHGISYCGNEAVEIDKILKPLGEEGWELVNTVPNSSGLGWWLFLKRPQK